MKDLTMEVYGFVDDESSELCFHTTKVSLMEAVYHIAFCGAKEKYRFLNGAGCLIDEAEIVDAAQHVVSIAKSKVI